MKNRTLTINSSQLKELTISQLFDKAHALDDIGLVTINVKYPTANFHYKVTCSNLGYSVDCWIDHVRNYDFDYRLNGSDYLPEAACRMIEPDSKDRSILWERLLERDYGHYSKIDLNDYEII